MVKQTKPLFYESDGVQSSSFDNMTSAELDMKRNISEDKQNREMHSLNSCMYCDGGKLEFWHFGFCNSYYKCKNCGQTNSGRLVMEKHEEKRKQEKRNRRMYYKIYTWFKGIIPIKLTSCIQYNTQVNKN